MPKRGHGRFRVVMIALLTAGLLTAAIGAVSSGQTTGSAITVSGRVVAHATEQPIRRAWVVVHAADTNTTRVGVTDLNGEFRFEGLPPGRYRVGASKRPFLATATDVSGEPAVLRLTMGATVFGVVTEAGRPVRDVRIALSGPSLVPRSATTDARGEYRIHGLPPGDYELRTARSLQPRTISLSPGDVLQALPLELQEATDRPQAVPAPVTGGTASIGGQVQDMRTGQPLGGVQVQLGRVGISTTTDSAGRFRFDKLRPGTFSVVAQQPGYFALATATVEAEATTRVSDVVLRIGRHAAISGTVRDDVGDPIVGMPVFAFRRSTMGLRPVSVTGGAVMTNERGAYQVDGLVPGNYIICACPDKPLPLDPLLLFALGLTSSSLAGITNELDETILKLPPTYFPGAVRGVDAELVALDQGDIRPGIDITVHGVKPFNVSGTVLENGGAPSEAVSLMLLPDESATGVEFISQPQPVQASVDGAFRLRGLTPGRYTVFAAAADRTRSLRGRAAIEVVDRDVEAVVLSVRSLSPVHGRIEFSGRGSVPDSGALSKATISLVPRDMFSMYQLITAATSGGIGTSATPDANGRFVIPNVNPGQYIVSVRIPGSNWRTVDRVTTGDGDVSLDALLTVRPEGTGELLVTVSDAAMANLEGTAVLARYQTPGGMRVMAFPADKSIWPDATTYPARFAFVFLAPNRTFRFEALPPGEYFVVVVPGMGFELSLDEMERWSRTAQRVRLRGGETLTLVLKQ